MRKLISITIIAILFMTFYAYHENTPKSNPEEITKKIKSIEKQTFEITKEQLKYTNLYETKPNITNVIFNIAHGIVYAMIVELNTLIPVIAHMTSNTITTTKWLISISIILITILIIKSIVLIISIYFFIKEKIKYKEKITD